MDWILAFLFIAFVVVLILVTFFYCERGLMNLTRRLCSNQTTVLHADRIFPLQERHLPWMNINPSIAKLSDPGALTTSGDVTASGNLTASGLPGSATYIVAYRLHRKEGFNWYWLSRLGISFLNSNLSTVDNFIIDDFPKGTDRIYGYEDPRVFIMNGEVKCLVTFSDKNVYKMLLLGIDTKERKLSSKILLQPDFEDSTVHQKNWNPFWNGEKFLFISRIQPHTIVDINTETGVVTRLHSTNSELFSSPEFKDVKIHGGTCPIQLDENTFLAVCHLKYVKSMLLTYRSLLYTFDSKPPYAIKSVSHPFVLESSYPDRIQMVFGLLDSEDCVIMTAGIMDETMAGYVVKKFELMKLFPPVAGSTQIAKSEI
jgi:predicted GH43/DUF377 family glycosyl hydrolase